MSTLAVSACLRGRRLFISKARKRFYCTWVQVAAVLPGEDCQEVDIVLHFREGGVKQIAPTHRSYDALSYPLLNPYGRDGWTPGLMDSRGKEISVLQFYGFHAQVGSMFKPF